MTVTTIQSKPVSFVMYSIGDEATGLEVAASGSLEGGPVDISRFDLNKSTIVLIRTAGTGTVKLTGEISANGFDDKVSLGDLITGVTSTPGTYKLSDAGVIYGHYLTLTAVETGGSNTADVRVVIMGNGS